MSKTLAKGLKTTIEEVLKQERLRTALFVDISSKKCMSKNLHRSIHGGTDSFGKWLYSGHRNSKNWRLFLMLQNKDTPLNPLSKTS